MWSEPLYSGIGDDGASHGNRLADRSYAKGCSRATFLFSSLVYLHSLGRSMTMEQLAQRKTEIRKTAHAARKSQQDKDQISERITSKVTSLPEYETANCVMWYVDVRDEARTRHALPEALASGKRVVIPYCVDGELELFHLESMEEMETGMYKILEPRSDLRDVAAKQVAVGELDLILVPGVAFDDRGGRTGHGKGYYDKLLENAKPETPLISLAFECQMFDEIPMQDHDIFMDKVVTEEKVYDGIGRKGQTEA
ncbi:MAG: 5-formyltetrahydrofolate cyclo-ligase [Rubripirellula sp.]